MKNDEKQTHGHHHEVEIKINKDFYKTHVGENSVAHLKDIGHVPSGEILSEFKHGQFVDLADNAHVEIHGGENIRQSHSRIEVGLRRHVF